MSEAKFAKQETDDGKIAVIDLRQPDVVIETYDSNGAAEEHCQRLYAEERRKLEQQEMENHFRKHPHG